MMHTSYKVRTIMVDEFWERTNTKLNMEQKQSSLSLYEKNNKFGYISPYNVLHIPFEQPFTHSIY